MSGLSYGSGGAQRFQLITGARDLPAMGGTFTTPANTRSVTFLSLVANLANPITVTTTDGTIGIDRANVELTWSVDHNLDTFIDPITFTTAGTARCYVIWTEQP